MVTSSPNGWSKASIRAFSSPATWPTAFINRRSPPPERAAPRPRSEEHTSELQSRFDLVCRLLLEKKKKKTKHERKIQQKNSQLSNIENEQNSVCDLQW